MSAPATILHLDLPQITPPNSEFEVQGWIASHAPVESVLLQRAGEAIRMALVDRPDAAAANTDFRHVTGFVGYGNIHFIADDRLVFHVATNGGVLAMPAALTPFPLRPINPLPDVPAHDAGVKREKLQRLAGRLTCPACRAAVLLADAGCRACGATFRFTATQLDFLNAAQRSAVPAPEATPASTGGYDEVAYAIIASCRDGLILDCGAGQKQRTFPNIINLEIMDYPSTDVRGVNESLPFADATFDAVFSFATLEHIPDPFAAAAEIARVLKPGGLVYSVVPLISPYHGFPNHFYNMTIAGHQGVFPADTLDVLHSFVPLYGRPVYALTWILRRWARGLPPAQREQFLELKVRDLATAPFTLLQQDYVRYLDAEANLQLAANTAIIARKR
ncbi:MAG TPA: class I SAM-dependent methyltransferase [Opitutus sp.]|nr:class I SAM-dependent methyltransferase [Opitutus sp.]